MQLHRAGVRVTINTDDPVLQETGLSDEVIAAKRLGASDGEIAAFQATACEAAFSRLK
jgi:adenosine deaminase